MKRLVSCIKRNSGMTLIELIVVIILMTMIIFVIYLMMSTATSIYGRTSEKVDAQSQFRITMDILEKEVGNAEKVDLTNVDPDAVSNPPAKYHYIYIKPGTDENALFVKSFGTDPKPLPPFPIPGFTMSFSPDPTNPTKVLKVTLSADGTVDYIGSIMLQNTTIDETGGPYNSVYYKDY